MIPVVLARFIIALVWGAAAAPIRPRLLQLIALLVTAAAIPIPAWPAQPSRVPLLLLLFAVFFWGMLRAWPAPLSACLS